MAGKGLSWSAVSVALAAIMGGAVAFLFVAMPREIFEGLVAATGVQALVSAAAPPLGTTARLVTAAGAGFLAFAVVFAVLRALDKPKRPRRYKVPAAPLQEAPRVRRADAHPDAPPRKPIFAGSEFGEPAFADPNATIIAQPAPATEPLPEPLETLSQRLPEAPQTEENIGQLMQRLERGIGKAGDARPAPPAPAEQERLRDVIAELRKMAGQGA